MRDRGWILVALTASAVGFATPVAGHAGNGVEDTFSCDVMAPLQTQCTTGAHTHTDELGLGFGQAGPYTGRGTNHLVWPGGEVTGSCLFVGGVPVFFTCTITGDPPAPGTEFEHLCVSEPAFMVPPVGTLRCVLTHD